MAFRMWRSSSSGWRAWVSIALVLAATFPQVGQAKPVGPDDERKGSFSCRASAIRDAAGEPVVANAPNWPCLDSRQSVLDITQATSGFYLTAAAARASTDQTPDDLSDTPPAAGDKAVSHSDVQTLAISSRHVPFIVLVQALWADASVICSGSDGQPPVLFASSQVTVNIDNQPNVTLRQPQTIPLAGGSALWLNQTTTEPGRITQRALVLTDPLGQEALVAGEAIAGYHEKPCGA